MRTINLKAAVILLIVVVVVACSTHLLHSYQLSRHSLTLHDMAVAAWNDTPRRDMDALRSMRDYLGLKPKDYQAVREYGGWLIESRRLTAAADTLEQLVRNLENEKEDFADRKMLPHVRRQLAILWMDGLHNYSNAAAHLKVLLPESLLAHPEQISLDDADLLRRLGDCYQKQAQYNKAIDCYKKALANEKNKCRVEIYYSLAMTYQYNLGDLAAAQKCMAEMIAAKANAESPHARQIYAMWLEEHGDYEQALQQAMIVLKLKKDFHDALYLASKCELVMRHFPKAAAYAARGLEVAPQAVEMYVQMSNVYDSQQHRKEAMDILRQGVKTLNSTAGKAELLWHLANFLLDAASGPDDAANRAEAEECIRQLSEFRFPAAQIEFLKARVLFANEDWEAARQAFEAVRPKLANSPPQMMKLLQYWMGYCCLQQGNPDQAMVEFRSSLSYDQSYFEARDGIAKIFAEMGRQKNAVEEYSEAANRNPADADAWLAYARSVLLLTLSSKEEERDWGPFDQVLNHAGLLHPNDSRLNMLLLNRELAQGRSEVAKKILDAIRNGPARTPATYVAEANLKADFGDLAGARKVLDDARAKLGDDCSLRLARASLALREPGEGAGEELEKLSENIDQYSTSQKIRLLSGLFGMLRDVKDFDRAKAVGRRLAALQPHDAIVRYRLLELDLASHDRRNPGPSLADIDRLLAEIKATAGEGPLWNYGMAVRLWLGGKPEQLDEAIKYAQEAERMRLNWSRPDVLMGEICRAQGKDEDALEHYLQASVNGDRDPAFNRVLVQMLYDRHRYKEAEEVFHRLENSRTEISSDLQQKLTDIDVQVGDFERALQDAKRSYAPASSDYHEHLWHGQVLRALARRARQEGHADKLNAIVANAEASLRKAIELAPEAAECRVELVLLLTEAEQSKKAAEVADEAELPGSVPSNIRPMVMGYIYRALGNKQKAAENYEKALAQRPDSPAVVRTLAEFYLGNGDSARAAPLVEKLLSGQLAVSEADRKTARRMKAELLVRQGFPKFKEALALIEQNLVPPPGSAEDIRLKVRILMADPATARSNETLALMESLVKPGGAPPEPRDRFALARLYLRRNDWGRCREQMEKLADAERPEIPYLQAYVKMLLDQGAKTDAELRLKKLEDKSKPGSAIALRAELMFLQGQWHAILPYLKEYLDKPGVVPEKRDDRLLVVAWLCEDFGTRLAKRRATPAERAAAQDFFDEAGKLLEEHAKGNPSGEMARAAFYARRGRLDEAIGLLKQFSIGRASRAPAEPAALAASAAAVINAEKVAPEQLQQLESVLTSASAAAKQPVPLLTALGLLKIVQNQPEQAEVFYRQVLARNPNDFQAYNNLALLLANSGKKTDEALDLINRAIELAGSQAALLDSRAVVRISRHEPQRALEDLETILNDPAEKLNPVWLFHKAWALKLADNPVEAGDVLHQARNEHDLDRAQIDPPERAAFDKLVEDLK